MTYKPVRTLSIEVDIQSAMGDERLFEKVLDRLQGDDGDVVFFGITRAVQRAKKFKDATEVRRMRYAWKDEERAVRVRQLRRVHGQGDRRAGRSLPRPGRGLPGSEGDRVTEWPTCPRCSANRWKYWDAGTYRFDYRVEPDPDTDDLAVVFHREDDETETETSFFYCDSCGLGDETWPAYSTQPTQVPPELEERWAEITDFLYHLRDTASNWINSDD